MKMNCQLYTAEQTFNAIFGDKENFDNIESIGFSENGNLYWYESGFYRVLPPSEIAYKINMPLWEVVSVSNGGENEFAILLFEGD